MFDHGSGSDEFHIHLERGEGDTHLVDTLDFRVKVTLDTVVDERDETS
jgi:hypothetical protein